MWGKEREGPQKEGRQRGAVEKEVRGGEVGEKKLNTLMFFNIKCHLTIGSPYR